MRSHEVTRNTHIVFRYLSEMPWGVTIDLMPNPYQPPQQENSAPTKSPRPHRAVWTFTAGAVLGMAMWVLSPLIAGETEPWDHNNYYLAALFGSGFLATWTGPKAFWAAPIGVYAGQAAVVIIGIPFTTTASLWPLGLAIAAVYTAVVSFAGAALAAGIYWVARKFA